MRIAYIFEDTNGWYFNDLERCNREGLDCRGLGMPKKIHAIRAALDEGFTHYQQGDRPVRIIPKYLRSGRV